MHGRSTEVVKTPQGSDEGFGVPVLLLDAIPPSERPASTTDRRRQPLPSAVQQHDQNEDIERVARFGSQGQAHQSPIPPSSPSPKVSSDDKIPSQSLSDFIATSSPPVRRQDLSSPLPPSSPPRDSSDPAPYDGQQQDEHEQQPQSGSSSFWDQPELDSNGDPIQYDMGPAEDTESSLFLTPNTRALRQERRQAADNAEFRAPAVDEEGDRPRPDEVEQTGDGEEEEEDDDCDLPTPGSGDSAYTASEYTCASDGPPQPADDQLLTRSVNCMASLSAEYRLKLEISRNLVAKVHDARKDALIARRFVSQETAMSLRMAQWLAFFENPAGKWHASSLWKQPMTLKIVDGRYVEDLSDYDEDEPPHGRTELKRCWIYDNAPPILADDTLQDAARDDQAEEEEQAAEEEEEEEGEFPEEE